MTAPDPIESTPLTVGDLLKLLQRRVRDGALNMDTPVTDARGNPLVAVWEARDTENTVLSGDLLFRAPGVEVGEPLGIYVTGVRDDTRAAGQLSGPFPNADHAQRWCVQTRDLNPGSTIVVAHLVAAQAQPFYRTIPAQQ